jgi:HJR/Mrr/RecB family endonuclease
MLESMCPNNGRINVAVDNTRVKLAVEKKQVNEMVASHGGKP